MSPAKAPASTTAVERLDGFFPIGRYAAVGDGRTAALIAPDGSVDWLCAPRFDSPGVFAAMLDPGRGGRFALAPTAPYEAAREYLPDTNVLQTTYRTADGTVRVTDAMTLEEGALPPWRELVRRVEGLSGSVELAWRVEPRFEFGTRPAGFTRRDRGAVASGPGVRLALAAWDAGEPQIDDGAAVSGAFSTAEGSRATLALVISQDEPTMLPHRAAVERRLDWTAEVWRRWVGRHGYDGAWKEAVSRSLLALRLLTDPGSGAMPAAATTSLPEVVGGTRNMDYRFGWIRDCGFTLDAFMHLGLQEDAHRSLLWMLRAAAGSHPRPAPLYRLDGSAAPSESELPLYGYRGSRPVKIGNQARSQLQLSGFGDLLQTVWMHVEGGGLLDAETGERVADLADVLCATWRHPDAGLWELTDYEQYTSSKMGVWVALQRTLDLVDAGQAPARHVDDWTRERDAVRAYVDDTLWSASRQSYVTHAGTESLDCACLLAARRGFVDGRDERFGATIDAVLHELDAGAPLLYRYSEAREEENAFLACSFWAVEALALAGRLDDAAERMESLLGLAGDVGLYSEEIEPGSRELVGNLPQALTHLSLINAAALFERAAARP
ncbi:MAG TPA: glycoside hydrolase family 15 protein [Solirubrobacteraceae bacterium]|nr:glycoside hydrolase family 15 protein [Solirubrobacteraceae bacterium]